MTIARRFISLFVARCDGAEMFDLLEVSLDGVALAMDEPAEGSVLVRADMDVKAANAQ